MAMYVETIKNRNSPPAILVRESFRQNGKVRKRTLANLSKLPPGAIEALRHYFKGETGSNGFEIIRTLPHGHVAAALGALRNCGLDTLIDRQRSPERDRVCAMIVARILDPGSKLATARGLAAETARDTLAAMLDIEDDVTEDELHDAMDWLLARKDPIERRLARRHLEEGTLVLYDLTSVWMEGRHCPLARFGHSRDGKRGKMQIEFGLLCDRKGWPVALEVFDGNTADPATVATRIDTLRRRFGLTRVVLVGDRGMLTSARIREDIKPAGLDWISALRAPAIKALVANGALQPSLFDSRDIAEITSPELYPGERLVVCRNPQLAAERARKRQDLLAATEKNLATVAAATQRAEGRLKGEDKIRARIGKVINRHKMQKHFILEVSDDSFAWRRDDANIAAEAALDGFYIVRTNLPKTALDTTETVAAYKGLSVVERAFRTMKTVALKVRPIHHRLAERVRAHLLICMLAYYVEHHMRECLAPMLFDDADGPQRDSIVAPPRPSHAARQKAAAKTTPDGMTVHSLPTLLKDLATIARNRVRPKNLAIPAFDMLTRPTELQEKALKLLDVRL